MAGWFVGPIMEKIINACSDYACSDYLEEQVERLREKHPKIQAVVFAANQTQISDQNPALNKWMWQLRDAIDEADDALDELECLKHREQLPKNAEQTKKRNISIFTSSGRIRDIYPTLKHKEQLAKNKEETKKRKFTSFLFESHLKFLKIGERGLKRDPNLKRLEEALQKLDKASTDVTTFLPLLDSAKQKHQKQQLGRETGSLPKNDLIGRSKEKEFVMEWLRKPSNEPGGTDLYRNISLLSIVGHGGMGKTTLLQHVYKDEEITKEFDLKMWVCVSNNFDVNRVIADVLESLKNKRPCLETLGKLQDRLCIAVRSKKFLLILEDIWEEEENGDISKWEDVLAPLADGKIGSRILVTTRTDSAAMMIATVIQKKTEIFRLEGLEEDKCLQLLNLHAFAGVENPPERLRAIAGEEVKRLLGSPFAAKVIGGFLNVYLNERHWRKVLESNLFRWNSIISILRLSYIVLPNHLQNCFAFCCMFQRDHKFDKDDLVQMWIALGFIQPSLNQEETMEDIGGKYFDDLVKANFFYEFKDVGRYYKMHDLIYELAQSVFINESFRLQDDTKFPYIIPQNLRHLSVTTGNSNILRKFGNLKYLRSLFLFSKASNQDLSNSLIEIFKASRGLRLLYVDAPSLEMIPEEIGNLIHLRYLKIICKDLTKLPRSLSNLYHLQ